MKILSNIFFGLSFIFLGLWAVFYIYVMSLACAFGSVNSNSCTVKMPWTLRGEDFSFLIGMPAVVFGFLLVMAFYLRKVAKDSDATKPSEEHHP